MKHLKSGGLLLMVAAGLVGHSTLSGQSGALRYVAMAPAQAQEQVPEAKPAEPVPATELSPAELSEAAYAVLDKNCLSCHGVGKRQHESVPLDRASYAKLLEKKHIVPGEPDKSLLYTSMTRDENRMPPPAKAPKVRAMPSAEEIETIRVWIAKGAPAPAAPAK